MSKQKKYTSFQELFDDIYTRITKQGKGSFIWDGYATQCQFRLDGLACAIGIVISDKIVKKLNLVSKNPSMGECNDITDTKEVCEVLFNFYDSRQAYFLERMQQAHDKACKRPPNNNFLKDFQNNAAKVAKEFSLKVPKV